MDTIGKYTLVRVIGEGGMGRVFEAIDPIIGRHVAIKTISLDVATDAEARARFFREAQAAGQLSHPNLITIHDIGDDAGTPYIVMEFLEGLDLSRKIRQERLSYDTKMQIMVDVCEGLAFAHHHAIVHRDIKPANIFVTTNGRVKILDFGLARSALSDVTRTGKILGTPSYMAPEQIRGGDVDQRADIFATGAVFYELLTGRKAFEGDSVANTLYKVLETQPTPVHQLDERLPAALSDVVERALAKDRGARFQTSSEMLDALTQAHGRTTRVERSNLETMPVPPPAGATAPPACRRTVAAITGWSIASVMVFGIAGFTLWESRAHDAGSPHRVAQPDLAPRPTAPPPGPGSEAAPSTSARGAVPTPSSPENNVAEAAMPKAPAAVGKPARREAPAIAAPPPAPTAQTAPNTPTTTGSAAPPPTAPPAAPAGPKPTPIEPPLVPSTVAVPPPPPAASAPVRAEENPVAAVQGLLARYRAALESRDIGALKEIWPALSGRQEEALRSEFEHSRAIAVGLDAVDIRPTSSGATVTCRRSYAVTTADGQTLRTATTMFMTLARRDGAWRIDTIHHEVAR